MSVFDVSTAAGQEDDVAYRQVELELWHPGCWTTEVTEEIPGTHVVEKSLYPTDERIKGDFVLATEDGAPMRDLLEAIDRRSVVDSVTVLRQSHNRARAVVTYARESSIVPEIVNSEFMPIEPVHITEGMEYWSVLVRADRLDDVVSSMKDDHDATIHGITEVDPDENIAFANLIDRIDGALSDRQLECLLHAEAAGYYNWPRDVSASDLADELDISGPTVLEHLRKGENKILDIVFEELRDLSRRV